VSRVEDIAHSLHCARQTVQTDRYGAVIMEAMTRNWTDERLEERFDRIDQRFDAVDRRFEQIDRRFEAVDRRFEQVHTEFRELRGEMNARFDATQRLIIQVGGGMIATTLVGFLGIIATQL
jgi:chaperonin cofactor prefoldin